MLGAVSPLQWHYSTIGFITFAALGLPLFAHLYHRFRTMHSRNATPFPFLDLPLELRTMVYDNLLEDAYYPPPPPCSKHQNSPFSWLVPSGLFTPAPTTTPSPPPHQLHHHQKSKPSNWLFMANKQTYNEFMEIMCKKTTFHLTVSPQNYAAATPLSTPTEPQAIEEKPPTESESRKIWNISPETLKHLHKCDIKLITTSAMLGVTDPRNMKPEDWALAKQIREELKEVSNVRELNLQVKAIGDPLWNPLWVWYHASQSLKTMGSSIESSTTPTGPKLNRITFSLDTWSPGENFLERNAESGGQWAWKCLHNHIVAPDGPGEVSVREFCARLYMECSTCRPELDSEDEGEE
ncbi:hypothetical protein K458DRAFT_304084 [Lentithecium fluviatile CBS 122367]|uniref:Uncharacterized protein n=1 Tax=Lentithecium fluviatile CBS 122367 TaxID=1168545 RepID=A0A6G1IZL7_9PLEO|nr:hypothetical protein K458DRAFT_304084 [Lentithecium fluviatile CBS 122367]